MPNMTNVADKQETQVKRDLPCEMKCTGMRLALWRDVAVGDMVEDGVDSSDGDLEGDQ